MLIAFIALFFIYQGQEKEGFYGFESYDNCVQQGYRNDFCKRVPLEACVTNCPVGTFIPKTFNTSAEL